MNIAIVKDAILPVKKYGGTERVVWALAHELSKMGHQVTLVLHKGSYCPFARVIELDSLKTVASQIPEGIDIVHFQDNVDSRDLDIPHVVTINGNNVANELLCHNPIFVSRNHANRNGRKAYVYNGLDWDEYGDACLTLPRKGYHFLGKAAWRVKNVKGAINITKQVKGATLEVLGGYRLNLKMGFRFTIDPRIHFHGMVDNQQKKLYIEKSQGLIFPIIWHEPFGLCLTESLYFGAPVYGTKMGSLPEIISPEVGWLGDDERQIANYLNEGVEFSPKLCHEYSVDRFNAHVMAVNYLAMYERVLNGESLT